MRAMWGERGSGVRKETWRGSLRGPGGQGREEDNPREGWGALRLDGGFSPAGWEDMEEMAGMGS